MSELLPRQARFMAVAFVGIGLFIVAWSLGWIELKPGRNRGAMFSDPHHWQITSIGLAFAGFGLAIPFQERRHPLLALLRTAAALAFVVPMFWILYLSGKAPVAMQWGFGAIVVFWTAVVLALKLYTRGHPPPAAVADPHDPLHQAETYLYWGRHAQARALLEDAIRQQPERAAEFQRRLDQLPPGR